MAVSVTTLVVGCAVGPREAAPLDIEREPKARKARARKTALVPNGPPTIRRTDYDNVLSQSPGHFFQRMPVNPVISGRQFIGYAILSLYAGVSPHPDGLYVGDIVVRVNGAEINTPDSFHMVWTNAKGRQSLEIDILRDNAPRRITYRIVE